MTASDLIQLLESSAGAVIVVVVLAVGIVVVVIAAVQRRAIKFYGLEIGADAAPPTPEATSQALPASPATAPAATPALPAPATAPAAAPAHPRSQGRDRKKRVVSGPPTILIVENYEETRLTFHRIVLDFTKGYDIIAVANGTDALYYLERRDVRLVVMEYNHPDISGVELVKAIKAISREIRIIMTTAYHTAEVERESRQAGVDYYLSKPFPLDRLENYVAHGLGHPPRFSWEP